MIKNLFLFYVCGMGGSLGWGGMGVGPFEFAGLVDLVNLTNETK